MDTSEALPVIESLASGNDPVSGERFPDESPLHDPFVIRALFTALRALERPGKEIAPSRLGRAGESWSDAEDEQVIRKFRAGITFNEIARSHQRSRGAIVSRLVRLGEIERKTAADRPTPSDDSQQAAKPWRKTERPQTGKPWPAEDDERLRELISAGNSADEIAVKLGRGRHCVEVRISKLGLSDSLASNDLPF